VYVIAILLLIAALTLLGAGIAYITGAAALLGLLANGNEDFLSALPGRVFSQMNVFAFLALPLFVLVGEIMNSGGVTRALVGLSMSLVARVRGAMGYVAVLTTVLFAGISGSAVADAAALSTTLVPEMTRRGYSVDYAGALIAAASILGPIIPPSIILVFYGAIMGTDVSALLAAGIVPGLLLAATLFVANAGFAWKQQHPGGRQDVRPPFWPALLRGLPALTIPLIIIAGIVLGWMTPTEAAAVAVFAAMLAAAAYRSLSVPMLWSALKRTIVLSGSIFAMLAASALVTLLATLTHTPQHIGRFIADLGLAGPSFMVVFTLAFVIVGMFSETQIGIALIAPLLVPIAIAQGAHPVHLGIVVCLTLAIGLITPPIGSSVIVVSAVTGTGYWRLIRATLPFAFVESALLVVIVAFPELSLALPRALGLL
jgi:tripartite ATP-independent transporter DctM subunit